MSNERLLEHINTFHEEYTRGEIDLASFGAGLNGCIQAMAGLDFHQHVKRGSYIARYMTHPTWASDGNVHDRRVDEKWLLAEFRDWLDDVTRIVRQQSSP